MLIAAAALIASFPAASYGQSRSSLSTELVAKAEAGDSDAQYATAYLVLAREMTNDRIPSLSDGEKARATAVRYLQEAARTGRPDAEHLLGSVYLSGIVVPQDAARAKELFLQSAEAGNADGENALGQMLFKGQAGAQDDVAAVKWFEKAVAQGHKAAMANLGYMYAQGRGVAKDEKKALELTRGAAVAGVREAQHNLGWIYEHGKGVDKDSAEAVRWYAAAAEQGYGPAQLNVGFIYAKGEAGGDVRQQLVTAVKWFALASTSDDKSVSATARKAIVYIAQRQAPDILNDGVSEAKKWVWAH
jgi:TPR repeat protein